MRAIGRKFSTFARMDRGQRRLMIEAGMFLVIARVWLLIVPFKRVAARLGTLDRPDGPPIQPGTAPDRSEEAMLANRIGQAVRRVAGNVPFRAVCLQQAVAGKMMLRRRGIGSVLHFGVAPARPPEGKLEAHAWLDAGVTRVTGYPIEPRFIEVACFR